MEEGHRGLVVEQGLTAAQRDRRLMDQEEQGEPLILLPHPAAAVEVEEQGVALDCQRDIQLEETGVTAAMAVMPLQRPHKRGQTVRPQAVEVEAAAAAIVMLAVISRERRAVTGATAK